MIARPGQVRLEGLVAGPTVSWEPTVEQLRDALQRAGAPADCLSLQIHGGQASIEPNDRLYPREQFAGPAAEVLTLALRFLLDGAGQTAPDEWMSTLRLTDYHQDHKVEVLIGLSEEGVQAVGREQPWIAARAPGLLQHLRLHWKVSLLITLALALGAWISRDFLFERWEQIWSGQEAGSESES